MVLAELPRWKHQNLITTVCIWAKEEMTYQVMHKAGDTLAAVLSRGRLSFEVGQRAVRGIAQGVEHIHQKGYVHRDLKPSNVVFAGETAVICDLDSARPVGTVEDTVFGTWSYVAPETALKILDNDRMRKLVPAGTVFTAQPPRDVYAIGVIACQALHGEMPNNLQGSLSDALPKPVAAQVAAHANPDQAAHEVFYVLLATGRLRATVDPTAPMAAMLQKCLERDASARPTAAVVVEALSAPLQCSRATGSRVESSTPRP
eukprot:TRINITY_DN45049_c0_g1_i1.p1 TRINITY_DN45049_c0_g1~~TRINITY_DN45049_c0_g1_i1.p1  ORF type:complete len:260 (+),score=43.85 TRINITY_DN45049_c0_g1_i1:134-913(+)